MDDVDNVADNNLYLKKTKKSCIHQRYNYMMGAKWAWLEFRCVMCSTWKAFLEPNITFLLEKRNIFILYFIYCNINRKYSAIIKCQWHIIIQLSHTGGIPIFWLVDLYHVILGYDKATSWRHYRGVIAVVWIQHHGHYTMASAHS